MHVTIAVTRNPLPNELAEMSDRLLSATRVAQASACRVETRLDLGAVALRFPEVGRVKCSSRPEVLEQ